MSAKDLIPGSNASNRGREGRPKGTRNLLQKKFIEELCSDFEQYGAGVIKICRIERPVEYLKVIASILPKELIVDAGILADLSDEELAQHIALLQRMRVVPHQAEAAPDDETKH